MRNKYTYTMIVPDKIHIEMGRESIRERGLRRWIWFCIFKYKGPTADPLDPIEWAFYICLLGKYVTIYG